MIHPSYKELAEAINKDAENEQPIVSSRYSVCVATAKRARQLIDGAEPTVTAKCNKPLSTAIDEIYSGTVKIQSLDDNTSTLDAPIYAEENL